MESASRMDYTRFMTDVTKNRKATLLRDLFNLQQQGRDDWIYVIAGLPNESFFPLKEGQFTMADGTKIILDKNTMKECLQYGPSGGYPPLVKQLEAMVKKHHNPPRWSERKLMTINGIQDGLAATVTMMMNERDFVLLAKPTYSTYLSLIQPYSPRILAIETDENGLIPGSLKGALSRWNPKEMSKAHKDVPKFLYMNPTGNNPTGTVLSADRRREIYDICCQYNLIIIEDDPYYFEQYTSEAYPPTFLELDTECRVIRLDSFSKTIGGGLRIGYAIGPKSLIEKLIFYQQVTTQHVSSLSQITLHQILNVWGEDGYEQHVEKVKEFYWKKRDDVVACAEKHLSELCEWNVPGGGLFMWIKVKNIPDVWDMLMKRAAAKKVVLVPGNGSMPDSSSPCPYVRVAFSHTPTEKIEEAFRRFAELIREEMSINKSTKG
ncbi:kynurenine/alpha-aminoadipate aminotransferase, mitochondrial-like isoform X2 [Macrobrachium nipponense]|uniref:kynurenine/alpha-aminoadipate aminotransferase, mitochondrial-like isoform X2 n=1 Tax=Macrobrachium nipponense TaxID=159736 RepID=UPI0030C8A1D5